MVVCGSCGTENPSGFRFCGACGSALGSTDCPSCGFANPAGHSFCGNCGLPLTGTAVPRPALLDERKLATVLFADVVGFTTLADTTDPETVARTVDAAFRRLAQVVTDHGGTIDKYMGDSLMAVFGVPQAHDDDAARAVAAALTMRELGGDLAFSIGINTGEVMVTAVGRDGEITVIGDTVNVAARLEKTAGPGEVLVGRLTADLASDQVVFRERQPVLLKGKREPVAVCEAVSLRTPADRDQGTLPLVGRNDELAFLRSHWRRVQHDGQAGVVLVTGEAGAGKTRLLEELAAEASDEGRVAWAAYPAYGGLGGPRVAAEVIRQLGPTGETEVDARVRSIAGEFHPSLRSLDPESIHQEQLWAFRRLLERKAAEEPLLIVIDDIHRSGEKTIDLLGDLMTRVGDVPVLLVLAGRPEPSDWLSRFPSATTVRVTALSKTHSRRLAHELMPDLPPSEDAADFLVDRSGGNPLYLRELARMMLDRGQLVAEQGEYALVGAGTVPPSLQAILAARLDALSSDEKAALQHVALLGDQATEAHVAALGISRPRPALASLVACGLLRSRNDGVYDVADPLLREVAYETLPRNLRADLHRRAAEAAGEPLERARHLDRAVSYMPGDEALAEQAARALADAGIDLVDTQRHADAYGLLRRALELGMREPAVVVRLADVANTTGHVDEIPALLELLPPDSGDPVIEAERVHLGASARMFRPDDETLEAYDEAVRRWRELGNAIKEAWGHANKGVALFNLGRMLEAEVALRRGLELFRAEGHRGGEIAVYAFLALLHPEDQEVAEWMVEALAYAEQVGDRSRQVNSLMALTWHHMFRSRLGGDADILVAETYCRRMADVSAELFIAEIRLHAVGLLWYLKRMAGRLDEALEWGEEAARVKVDKEAGSAAFGCAVAFAAALAGPHPETAVRPPSLDAQEPLVAVAKLLEAEALVLAGRLDEVAGVIAEVRHGSGLGAVDGVAGNYVDALAAVLTGQYEHARPLLDAALVSARRIRARPAEAVMLALSAETIVRTGGDRRDARQVLADLPTPLPEGMAGAFVLRAQAVLGDGEARKQLEHAADTLEAPGLLIGID